MSSVASTSQHGLGTVDLAPGWGRLVPETALRAGPPPLPSKGYTVSQ